MLLKVVARFVIRLAVRLRMQGRLKAAPIGRFIGREIPTLGGVCGLFCTA
jgi:hypothetical protein